MDIHNIPPAVLMIGGFLAWGCLFVLVSDFMDWLGRRRG